jgi:hypothetical protein
MSVISSLPLHEQVIIIFLLFGAPSGRLLEGRL